MKKSILAVIGVLASATPAFAHHPLGGQPMETFSHGLLSGIGHPLLGFDHLFFVVAVGIAALFTGYARLAPAAYIGAMLVGCLLMSFGIGLPFKEIIVGLSLLVVGYIILSGRTLGLMPAAALFAIFGLFHGSAFGDVIAAQEASVGAPVLFGYLIGLGFLQYGIALASGYAIAKIWKVTTAQAVEARIAGAAVAGMGVFLTLENLEGIVLGALV